jgi:UDP-N-acetylmuramyl pentapeptide phosphotransferase/UDP-N-acetylglucosamine-1-phosphate transferase
MASGAVPMTPYAYDWLPWGLNNPIILTVAGTLIVTGFVNAGNMADGANGLLGIVGVSFLSVLLFHDHGSFSAFFIMALLIFVIFNVSTGRIFLGDFGAYGLSAMIGFGSLDLYAAGNVSLWFLGSLLAYPCLEMVRVIVARTLQGSSPLQASNDHLHNFLYDLLRKRGLNRIVANSSTGLFVGAITALLPASLVFSDVMDASATNLWGLYFGSYAALHLGFAIRLKRAIYAK